MLAISNCRLGIRPFRLVWIVKVRDIKKNTGIKDDLWKQCSFMSPVGD